MSGAVIRETCSCGATFSITTMSMSTASAAAATWRKGHKHAERLAEARSRIVSETWVDADGIHRHSNCRGFACKVPNCRDSQVCQRDPSKPNSVADDFPVQFVRARDDDPGTEQRP